MKMTYTGYSTRGLKTGVFLLLFLMGCNALAQLGSATVRNELSKIEKQNLLSLVNEARSKGCKCGNRKMPPAAAVAWDDRLESAAVRHSLDMSARNFLSHTGSDGSTLSERITAAGFIWNSCGENIALGYKTEQQVVEGWLKSPEHCKNIMNQEFRFMGVARSGTYWTQDFGGRQQGP
jgi:uncharacterized protein YkwD